MILTLLLIIIQGPCQIPVTWITYKVTQTHATWTSNVHRAHIRRQVFVKKSILYTNKKWNALFGVQTFQHIDTSNLYFKWRHVNPSTLQPIISRRFNPYLFRQFNPCFAKLSNLKRVYSKDIVLYVLNVLDACSPIEVIDKVWICCWPVDMIIMSIIIYHIYIALFHTFEYVQKCFTLLRVW